ncbi:MAG: ATP-binding protein [Pseudohongiellaceae bacterium]
MVPPTPKQAPKKTHQRLITPQLHEALSDSPVVLIHGPRQSGKTTLALQIAKERDYHYISFDDDNQLQIAKTDPIGFVLSLPERCILDEIQRIPKLFTSIKASVDKNRQPGRFILTGSANVLLLPNLSDSLAGRMEILRLRPLAQCEVSGGQPGLLTHMFNADIKTLGQCRLQHLGAKLVDLVHAGGYPAALNRRTPGRRRRWYRDYITTIVQRDLQDISKISDLDVMPRLLEFAAGQTARLFNASNLAAPFNLSRPTIRDYLALLEQIFLIERLQPWHSNRLSRLVRTPKLHLADTGLAATLLNVDSKTLRADRALFGQLLETWVYQELRKQADWHEAEFHFHHFRDNTQAEVDIVLQQGRRLLGVETKAAATVRTDDFRGLKKLRDAAGEQFAAGILFYDGDSILPFGRKFLAVPLSVLV